MKREDYPDVNNWNRPQNAKAHCKCIIVTDTSEISADTVNSTTLTDSDDNDDDDSDSDKKGVPAFLVGTDGKLLSVEYKKQIYSSVKGFFNDNVNPKNVPINYSSSGKTLHENFRNFIETKYKPLSLCSGHWKANALFIRQYHGWLRSYRCRMAKEGKMINVIEMKKWKPRDNTIDDADGDEEDREQWGWRRTAAKETEGSGEGTAHLLSLLYWMLLP